MMIAKITSLGGTGLQILQSHISHTQKFCLLRQEAGALDCLQLSQVVKGWWKLH